MLKSPLKTQFAITTFLAAVLREHGELLSEIERIAKLETDLRAERERIIQTGNIDDPDCVLKASAAEIKASMCGPKRLQLLALEPPILARLEVEANGVISVLRRAGVEVENAFTAKLNEALAPFIADKATRELQVRGFITSRKRGTRFM